MTTEVRPRKAPRRWTAGVLVALAVAMAGCGDAGAPGREPAASPSPDPIAIPSVDGPYDWSIDPNDFVSEVDNPYFPLAPGTTLVYEGGSGADREVVTIEVLDRTEEILGITATIVHDTVEVGGVLHEDTFDWYAQDRDGNVWYLGEDTKEYEDGEVVSTEGSWEAGVDGALPGIIMPADPAVGLAYTQEHYAGEAEDKGRVVSLDGHVTVPYGSFDRVVTTEDWTPLEPRFREHKHYAPGIGVVFEEIVRGGEGVLRLVSVTP